MKNTELAQLGNRVAALRIARQLKQTELAYEAGVSHRTLQRLEAGEVVKSDGLIKVIKCLDRLEGVMAALDSAAFSPFEMLSKTGLSLSQLDKQAADTAVSHTGKRRVRRAGEAAKSGAGSAQGVEESAPGKKVSVQWPEDQQ
jgi:transcriptional regulator with XRE-family HTH domain